MKKYLISLLSILMLLVALVGCNTPEKKDFDDYKKDKNVYVFGMTHKKYLGYIHAKTDNDGDLKSLVLDEIFMPVDYAKVKQADAASVNAPTIKIDETFYAKYIYIGKDKYTGANIDGAITYKLGETDINLVYKDQDFAKNYYDKALDYMKTKNSDSMAFGGGEDGSLRVGMGKSQGQLPMGAGASTGAGYSLFKRESGYWGNMSAGQGLHRNYDALQEYFREFGLKTDLATVTEKNESGYWKVGSITTGATLVDIKDYLELGNKLYEIIKE